MALASSSGWLPSRTAAMELRAIRRRDWRWISVNMAADEHQVADVDDQPGCLSHDEHRIAAMDCVDRRDRAADERQVPELDRNVAPLLPLRDDPLHDETRREDELPGETDDEPEVPDHVVTGCRLPVTGATRGQ